MPINLTGSLSKSIHDLANKSTIGSIVSNPIWFSIIIVITIMGILSLCDMSGWTFKIFFYMSAAVLALVTAHDWIIDDKRREKLDSSETNRFLKNTTGGDLQPRHFNPDVEFLRSI